MRSEGGVKKLCIIIMMSSAMKQLVSVVSGFVDRALLPLI